MGYFHEVLPLRRPSAARRSTVDDPLLPLFVTPVNHCHQVQTVSTLTQLGLLPSYLPPYRSAGAGPGTPAPFTLLLPNPALSPGSNLTFDVVAHSVFGAQSAPATVLVSVDASTSVSLTPRVTVVPAAPSSLGTLPPSTNTSVHLTRVDGAAFSVVIDRGPCIGPSVPLTVSWAVVGTATVPGLGPGYVVPPLTSSALTPVGVADPFAISLQGVALAVGGLYTLQATVTVGVGAGADPSLTRVSPLVTVRGTPLPQGVALVPVIAPLPTLTGTLNHITLDGAGSYDLDNTTTTPMGYAWACDKGVVSSAGGPGTVFTAPCIPANSTSGLPPVLPTTPSVTTSLLPVGVYRFTLFVSKVRL